MAPFPIRKALAIIIPAITVILLFVLAGDAFDYFMSLYKSGRVTTALQMPAWVMVIFTPLV
ncbi:hypothetical protein [Halalkalibacter nanhaiisediminis]|uniref:hypothetical protein n=1 Tax=Halalkalibacter nanhaiisediminis TaxID=688079 RepID=UPI001F558C14|nr:hypothetical protein [Halalkalibacter nanhaiisediminis]